MKKIILVLMSITMLLSLSACGGSTAPAATPAPVPAEASTPAAEPAPAAQPESEAAPAEEAAPAADPLEEARLAIMAEDDARAVELLDPLVKNGDPRAKYLMGKLYLDLYYDAEQALPLLEEAAEAGVSDALADIGRAYERARDYGSAEQYYSKAAEAGSLYACYRMGSMYNSARLDGLHDFAVSESWFLRGAEQGDSDCLYGLGRLYAYGGMCQDNYGRDAEKALYYLQQAGERGDALNVLGELYRSGVAGNDWTYAEDGGLTFQTTLEADPARALDCFRRALECESPSEFALDNLVSLGKDLQEGRGMEQNTELAKEAFRIAAEHGSEEAQQLMQSLG